MSRRDPRGGEGKVGAAASFYLYYSDTGIPLPQAPLLFTLVVADLGLLSEELAEGSLLLGASGRGPAEDADLPGVGVDHHIRFDHRGEAEVPQHRPRVVDDLMSRLRSRGQRHVVTLRNSDLFPTDPQGARALQHVDGLLVGEVVMVGPSPAPSRHLVEAAPQLL